MEPQQLRHLRRLLQLGCCLYLMRGNLAAYCSYGTILYEGIKKIYYLGTVIENATSNIHIDYLGTNTDIDIDYPY